MTKRTQLISLVAMSLLLAGWLLWQTVFAAGLAVMVNTTGDSGDASPGDGLCDTDLVIVGDQCSLRAAIEEINALGVQSTPHLIQFNIPGAGPHIITPTAELPALTVPVAINGTTQPGASCPTSDAPAELLIVLDGSSAGTNADGLSFNAGSDGSSVRGLVIGKFDGQGVLISSNDNRVGCNHIGIGVDGISVIGNGASGVYLAGNGNHVGGQVSPQQRNVISGNFRGVHILGEENHVTNNFIGTTSDGMGTVSNGSGILGNVGGIYVTGNNNDIGGLGAAARNVISGNNGSGISVNNGESNVIFGNYIGVGRDGDTPLPNNYGIQLNGAAIGNVVGGTVGGESNLIANSGVNGVQLQTNVGGTPLQNEIRGNSIFDNGGLGIDLGNDGVDSNDPGDGDGDENGGQNYPVLLTATDSVTISGTLNSEANTEYRVDIYRSVSCDPSGYGEGQGYLATDTLTTDGVGNADFEVSLPFLSLSAGNSITATATDPDGNTSEFSACITVETSIPENYLYLPIILR